MRGSPLIRAALTFLVLLALAPLLWQMTRPAGAAATLATPVESAPSKVSLELAFTTVPKHIAITHLGKVVWEKEAPDAKEECALSVPWPAQGGELKFNLEWPAGGPLSAMRVRLTDPNRLEMERSLWGRGPVEKVLNFP